MPPAEMLRIRQSSRRVPICKAPTRSRLTYRSPLRRSGRAGHVDRVALERAIATLPPGYRLVFVLHDIEGYEHNEIAAMLECSTGNSKSQLHKARLKLRELLKQSEMAVRQEVA